MKKLKFLTILLSCLFLNLNAAQERPKIYDCFCFFNELELLEIRLEELYDHVDKFVLIESVETFQGNPKPLYFEENKHLFEKYQDKIIHLKIESYIQIEDPWKREAFQRNLLMNGLEECEDHDIVLISDIDEILRQKTIGYIRAILKSKPEETILCRLNLYRYFFNRFESDSWPGTLALLYRELKKTHSPELHRNATRNGTNYEIENAGWHFCSIGGLERVIEKYQAYAEVKMNTAKNRDPEVFQAQVSRLQWVPIDQTFPESVYENQAKWQSLGFIEDPILN